MAASAKICFFWKIPQHVFKCASLPRDTLPGVVLVLGDHAKWQAARDTERYASVSASPALPEDTVQSAEAPHDIPATAFPAVLDDEPCSAQQSRDRLLD